MLETARNGCGLTDSSKLRELRRRMAKPQRHRLLHGYPLAAAMPSADDRERLDMFHVHPTSGRGLLIGVLPHPCCNAALDGCGFCTFPHEPYRARKVASIVDHVVREIQTRVGVEPSLRYVVVWGMTRCRNVRCAEHLVSHAVHSGTSPSVQGWIEPYLRQCVALLMLVPALDVSVCIRCCCNQAGQPG